MKDVRCCRAVAGDDFALGLPLKVATIILGCILSMLLSDFRALVPTPLALTEFFHADTVASVHPLPVIFNILTMRVSVFLYAYYVYAMFYGRCSQLW